MSQDDAQQTSREAQDEELTIGARLRAAREDQPLSLAQISAELRIELGYLTALEEDRLDQFPAPVFTKGYLKQYGGLLGLDERDLLAQYYRQVDERDAPVMHIKPIRLRDEDQIRHWVAAGLVLMLLIGGFVAWWFSRTEPAPVPVERTVEPIPEPPPMTQLPAQETAAPVTLPTLVEATEQPTEPNEPVLVGPARQSATVPGEPAPGVAVQVEVSFLEDCWTEISDARGERLFYGLGSAGARSRFSARLPISVFLGNASGVALTVDGEPFAIPVESRQGNLARFVISDSEV